MDPPRPPSPPAGPPRGTWASFRNVAAPSPPSPARIQTLTTSKNITQFSHAALTWPPRSSRSRLGRAPWLGQVGSMPLVGGKQRPDGRLEVAHRVAGAGRG